MSNNYKRHREILDEEIKQARGIDKFYGRFGQIMESGKITSTKTLNDLKQSQNNPLSTMGIW